MKTGLEPVHPVESYTIPAYQQLPTVVAAQPGITLRDHLSIVAMQAILSRTDAGIFNPDDVAEKACLQAEAMLRRMP